MKAVRVLVTTLVTIIICIEASAKGRRGKENRREKEKFGITKETANLCTMEGNEQALHCVCVGGRPPYNTTSAECIIFTEIRQDHSVWGLFSTQPHITELKFIVRPQAPFNFIPTKGLKHLRHLQSLTIMYASISDIHKYAFANISTLKELSLTRNQIVTLQGYSFAHLHSLLEVDLDENRISEIEKDVFVDLPNLQKFCASRNNISNIQEGAFRHLTHLLELELDINSISVLTRETFTGLSELHKIDLSWNHIEMLGDLTFSELWVLEDLNLQQNQIKFISDRAFAGLTQLKKLGLGNNKLTVLSSGLLGGVSTINHLDLRFNDLETLTAESVQPILHNLLNTSSYFYVSDNKFACDCRLGWMHKLRNETKNDRVRTSLDEIKCSMATSEPRHRAAVVATTTEEAFNQFLDTSGDYEYKDRDYNLGYDEQKDSSQNLMSASESGNRSKLKAFFDIPIQDLPCPQVEKPSESPRTLLNTPGDSPGFAGINLSGCPELHSSLLTLIITLVLRFT